MVLPSDFTSLSVPDQLFVAIDRERVDRGLAPFAGLDTALNAGAQRGADHAQLPRAPGHTFRRGQHGMDRRRRQRARCRLPVDVRRRARQRRSRLHEQQDVWLLGRSRHRAQPFRGTRTHPRHGCRLRPRRRHLSPATLAGRRWRPRWPSTPARHVRYSYTWRQALAATAAGTLQPLHGLAATESDTGIPDPRHNVVARARLHADLRSRWSGRLPGLYQCSPWRHQPRAHGGGCARPWCCRSGSRS